MRVVTDARKHESDEGLHIKFYKCRFANTDCMTPYNRAHHNWTDLNVKAFLNS